MIRRTPLLTAAVVLAAAAVAPADSHPIKVLACPRFADPPAIDGNLADACWRAATEAGGFTLYSRPKPAGVQTSFRVGYDERHLYLAVRCDEPLIGRLTPDAAGRDTKGCFRGETVEVFIDPAHDHETYYQLAVNLAGSLYDARGTDKAWNAEIRRATRMLDDAWTLELALPWRAVGLEPAEGAVVGFNVCRDRFVGKREWTNWSQTRRNFHDVACFGHLVLSPTGKRLGELGEEFRKGGRTGPIELAVPSGKARDAYRGMAGDALAGLERIIADLADEAAGDPFEPARKEVTTRLEMARHLIAPFRKRLKDPEPLGAAEWRKMSYRMADLAGRLRELVWQARLSALLEQI